MNTSEQIRIRRKTLKLSRQISRTLVRDTALAFMTAATGITLARYHHDGNDPAVDVVRKGKSGGYNMLRFQLPINGPAADLVELVVKKLAPENDAEWAVIFRAEAQTTSQIDRLPNVLQPDRHRIAVMLDPFVDSETDFPEMGFDLVLTVDENFQNLRALWMASALEPVVVTNLLRNLRDSLHDSLFHPDQDVKNCGAPRGAEQRALITHSRGPDRRTPRHESLVETFIQKSQSSPESVAMICSGPEPGRVTYSELEGEAGALARELADAGVGAGDIVVVALQRSVSSVAALLAIAALGAVYVPMDPQFPTAYLSMILSRLDAKAIIIHGAGPSLSADVLEICVDDIHDSGPLTNAPRPKDADFAIFFTSGSTGIPKGVVHTETQFLNRLKWMWKAYPFSQGDITCHRSPLTVMPSAWEILGGLLQGYPTAIVSPDTGRDPAALAAFLLDAQVSRITVLPSLLERLLQQKVQPGSLRLVTVGGEMIPPGLVDRFQRQHPDAILLEDFGCTETNTIWYNVLHAPDLHKVGAGCPISNMSAYVLDRWGHPARRGVIGQLAVSGPSLATRYLDDPELTKVKFTANDIDPQAGKRLFKTGDLAFLSEDYEIEKIGRADFQMKIRGMTVDPSEIEAALSALPEVTAWAAVTAPAPKEGGELVLFVETTAGATITEQSLRDLLAVRLPDFMVPTRMIFLDVLPRTTSQKIDRRRLAEMAAERSAAPSVIASMRETIRNLTADILGRRLSFQDDLTAFAKLGVDSARVVTLAQRLSLTLGCDVQATSLFEHHSIQALASFLEYSDQLPAPSLHSTRPEAADIAVVGMAGRFPGAADVDALWQVLRAGKDMTTEVPPDRWDANAIYDSSLGQSGRSISKWGAFLSQIDAFDAERFQIAPSDARLLDPQQRIGLEVAWHAFEDAGYARDTLQKITTGTFIGVRSAGWDIYLERLCMAHGRARLLGADTSMLASGIASSMRLSGPSLTLDTACSSSLAALHVACDSLLSGQCDMALTGGVCLALTPDIYIGTSRLGVLSPTGRCRPFDQRADGFVQGEGGAFVVLKRLADAQKSNDNIHAVIKGSALDSCGDTNGVGAPSLQSQVRVQQAVHDRFDLDPSSVGLIEAHGTGTPLGDQIEIEALRRTYASARKCSIGSLKANIGHLTAAAGIAGFVKAVLCLKHKYLPPAVELSAVNPALSLAQTPFEIHAHGKEWPRPENGRRRAAVNSFGFGGTNVHCILEEAPERPMVAVAQPELIVICGPTPAAVQAQAAALVTALSRAEQPSSLTDIAYTLLVGREPGAYRRWWVGNSIDDLIRDLEEGTSANSGQVQEVLISPNPVLASDQETEALYAELRDAPQRRTSTLRALAQTKIRIDPDRLFQAGTTGRVSLPGTVFQRQRFWPESTGAVVDLPTNADALPASSTGQTLATDEKDRHDIVLAALSALLGLSPDAITSAKTLSELGYDSVTSVDLMAELQARHAMDVDIGVLTVNGGFDELYHNIEKALESKEPVVVPAASRFALTGVQRSFVFGKAASGWTSGSHAYHEFEVNDLDPARLESAWSAVTKRHPILRTVLHSDGTQSISSDPLPKADISIDLEKTEFEARTDSLRSMLVDHVFRTEEWPLFKLAMSTRQKTGRSLVQISIDATLLDAQSADIVFDSWKAAYEGRTVGREDKKFIDHISTDQNRTTDPEVQAQHNYWCTKLRGCPSGPVLPKPEVPSETRWQRLSAVLPAEDWAPSRDKAEMLSVFPTTVLLAQFMRALDCQTQDCSLVLTHAHHRPAPAEGTCAGPFTSLSCVVQTRVSEDFDTYVHALNQQLSEDLANRDACASRAMAELAQTQTLAEFPVVFSCDLRDRRAAPPNWLFSTTKTIMQTPGVALECRAVVRNGALHLFFDIDATAVCERWAGNALCKLVRLLRGSEKDHIPPLTRLQRGLMAGRLLPAQDQWREAIVYQEFDVAQIDIAKMEAELDRLFETELGLQLPNDTGTARQTQKRLPPRIDLCDLFLTAPQARLDLLAGIRDHLLSPRPYNALDPAIEIVVASLGPQLTSIHIATDMISLDGFGVLLLYRQLLKSCRGVPERLDEAPVTSPVPAYRLETRIEDAAALHNAARKHDLTLDAVLITLLSDTLGTAGIPATQWTLALPLQGRGGKAVPLAGDNTVVIPLSVTRSSEEFTTRAAHVKAGIETGLATRPDATVATLSYTGCLAETQLQWPAAQWGYGITLTPGTAFDCYAHDTNGVLTIHWDIRDSFSSRHEMEAARSAFQARLRLLAEDPLAWHAVQASSPFTNSAMT